MDHPLLTAVEQMRAAKDAYDEACRNAWPVLLATHPQIRNVLKEWDMDATLAAHWFCTASFDDGRKTAVELFAEGRGEDVFRPHQSDCARGLSMSVEVRPVATVD